MRVLTASIAIFAAAIAGWSAASAQQVISDVGLVSPEAIRYDPDNDRYLISNIGSRGETPNDGFISVMSPEGTIAELKWIAGGANGVELNDPLGLFVHDGTLYVADTDTVRQFSIESGEQIAATTVEGAVRLNDLAVAEDGTVYVTDSGSDETPGAIFKITADGTVTPFVARSAELARPNGIAILPDGNIVHGGRSTELFVRSPDGAIVEQWTLPTGRFDGIVALDGGSLLVASQDGHVVYHVSPGGEAEVVAEDIEVPAAIGLDTERNRLLVPQIRAANITLVDLD